MAVFLPQKPPMGPRAASCVIPLPFPCRMPKIPLPGGLAFGSESYEKEYILGSERAYLGCRNEFLPAVRERRAADMTTGFATRRIAEAPDAIAPDGSELRVMSELARGRMSHVSTT